MLVGTKCDRPWEAEATAGLPLVTEASLRAAVKEMGPETSSEDEGEAVEGEKGGHLTTMHTILGIYSVLICISSEEATALAEQYNIPYIECSVKSGENVQNVSATVEHEIFLMRREV